MQRLIFTYTLAILCASIQVSCSQIDRTTIDSIESYESIESQTPSEIKSPTTIVVEKLHQTYKAAAPLAISAYNYTAPLVRTALYTTSEFTTGTIIPYIKNHLNPHDNDASYEQDATAHHENHILSDYCEVPSEEELSCNFYDVQTAQASLKDDRAETIYKYNQTIERLYSTNPQDITIQEKILAKYTLAQDVTAQGEDLIIDASIARRLQVIQEKITREKILYLARENESKMKFYEDKQKELETERDFAIQQAQETYTKKQASRAQIRQNELKDAGKTIKILINNLQHLNEHSGNIAANASLPDSAIYNDPMECQAYLITQLKEPVTQHKKHKK